LCFAGKRILKCSDKNYLTHRSYDGVVARKPPSKNGRAQVRVKEKLHQQDK